MISSNKIKKYYYVRIGVFGMIGVACYIFFALQPENYFQKLPNLWEIVITGFGGLMISVATYFFSKWKTIRNIDEHLMTGIDEACDKLALADDQEKLEPQGENGLPKLLIQPIYEFGADIIKFFCSEQVFPLVDAGVFTIRDPLLPDHEMTIYPPKFSNKIDQNFWVLLERYVEFFPGTLGIVETQGPNIISKILDEDYKALDLKGTEIQEFIDKTKIKLPTKKATISPVEMDNVNLGYLILFYHKQKPFLKIFEPREMIDNSMLKNIEEWKLNNAIRSILDKERYLLVFYLINQLDKIFNRLILHYKEQNGEFKLKPRAIHIEILEILTNVFKAEKGGYIWIKKSNRMTTLRVEAPKQQVLSKIVPYVQRSQEEKNIKADEVGLKKVFRSKNPFNFNNLLFVNVALENDYIGQIGLFSDREFERFDVMALDLAEDIKLDDMLSVIHRSLDK